MKKFLLFSLVSALLCTNVLASTPKKDKEEESVDLHLTPDLETSATGEDDASSAVEEWSEIDIFSCLFNYYFG